MAFCPETDERTAKPLTLVVNDFDVLDKDYVQVFDGIDGEGEAMHVGRGFGGDQRPPVKFQSKQGKLFVRFTTNPIRSGRGFNMTFSTSELLITLINNYQSIRLSPTRHSRLRLSFDI